MIRTLIIDDEPLARHGLKTRLEHENDITLIGEASDGPSAVDAIRAEQPDLVFLDVQMPGMDGFQVLEQVSQHHLPRVVFVTAYDVHAIHAFEINALDYLLKPYSEQRLQVSLDRVRHEFAHADADIERERLREMLELLQANRYSMERSAPLVFPGRFAIRERERVIIIRTEDLVAAEAAANYVQLVVGARQHLMRLTLAAMEQQLDPARFVRIHRSTIVNSDHIREIRLDPHGSGEVVLDQGSVYRMSRAYRERVLPHFGGRIAT